MSSEKILIAFTTLICIALTVEGYRVLYATSVPSPSHGRLAQGYLRQLLKKGHQVTYLAPFPLKDSTANVSQVDIGFIMEALSPDLLTFDYFLSQSDDANVLHDWITLMDDLTRVALQHHTVQNFIKDKGQTFDLVIVDWMFNELFVGFAALYQCPLVYATSFDVHSGVLSLVDEAANPAYTDDVMITYQKPYTFLQRVHMLWALLTNIFLIQTLRTKTVVDYENVFAEAARLRGVTLPPFDDVIHNASLVLVNTHASYGSSSKLPQNVKPVGGFYIDSCTTPLPQDLQKIMDDSKDGVVYFSFGSNAKAKDIPVEMRKALVNMFAGLKQTVLWKFEEDLHDLPKNIITRKWMPQSSILQHKNLKVFITHGGMLSTTEAVHHGVPIIGVPLFGDQYVNIKRMARKGFAVKVSLTSNLATDLKVALDQILTNPSYAATAKRLSSLYHDRPLPPGEELVYWLEYAVRTGGAPHLRSAALLLPWYQRLYVDLLALILTGISILVVLVKFILNSFFKFFRSKSYNQKKKTN